MKKLLLGLAYVSAFFMPVQHVAAREFADIYTECGLGAMIAPNNAAVAAVTNVTWDLGTTAISSNASSADSCKGGKPKEAAFIHETYTNLAQDMARGKGKHLDTLAALSGCDVNAQDSLKKAIRADFTTLLNAPGYALQTRFEQAKNLYDALNQRIEKDFNGSCNQI